MGRKAFLFTLVAIFALGYGGRALADTDTGTVAGTDVGTDAGTDAGTDVGTDVGTGTSDVGTTDTEDAADTETSAQGNQCIAECPVDSGYPCPCTKLGGSCDDGASCRMLSPQSDYGVCFRSCSVAGDLESCKVGFDCEAVGKCNVTWSDGSRWCGLICSEDNECPGNMICDKTLGVGICAGAVEEHVPTEPCEECPADSGYPCGCEQLYHDCADGSFCMTLRSGETKGSCMRECAKNSDCFIDMDCGGIGACALTGSSGAKYCAYLCDDDDDCPPGTACDNGSGRKLCYGGPIITDGGGGEGEGEGGGEGEGEGDTGGSVIDDSMNTDAGSAGTDSDIGTDGPVGIDLSEDNSGCSCNKLGDRPSNNVSVFSILRSLF